MKSFFFLAMTQDMSFYECFKDNLKYIGYKPIIFRSSRSNFNKFFNLLKLVVFTFFWGKKSKGLMIRADLFSNTFIKIFTSKLKISYGYQWDGLFRYPRIVNKTYLFDKFYVFDKQDLKGNKDLYSLNNFYFDCYKDLQENEKEEYDIYYVGSYDDRIEKIIEVCSYLDAMGLKMKIKIPCSGKQAEHLKRYSFIDTSKSARTYFENLQNVFKSKILLDFSHEKLHQGLSFRVFEALGYDKKLITTNELIKEEKFYNSSNFHVYTGDMKNLEEFIYNEKDIINTSLKNQYSFTSWVTDIIS